MPRLIISRPAAHAQTAMLPEGPREQTPFERLAETRQRITNGFAWMQGNLDANQPGARRLTRLLVKEYMPALYAFRDQMTDAEREDMATAYAKRLDGIEDDDEYLSKLNDYYVAADLADQTLVSWMLDRVRFWEEAGK